MISILDTIIEHKKMEVLKRNSRKPLSLLKEKPYYHRATAAPSGFFIPGEAGIIAEFKRKSPSKGMISDVIDPVGVVKAYKEGGAIASSVLTDRDFFGGSFRDLENVRASVGDFPLLRKDFIIDSYQVHEAKAYGADIILLIAAVLDKKKIGELAAEAAALGLSVLLEVHTEEEIDKWVPGIEMVGVNNRDLKDFSVDIQRSVELFPKLPKEAFLVSESGINAPSDVKMLFNAGFRGFLIGERFMREADPGASLTQFLEELKKG